MLRWSPVPEKPMNCSWKADELFLKSRWTVPEKPMKSMTAGLF